MDEIDQMEQEFMDGFRAREAVAQAEAQAAQESRLYPLSYANASLAQTPQPAPQPESLLSRQVGPLPLWGWGAIALLGGGAYYLYSQQQKSGSVRKNSGATSSDDDGVGEVESNSGAGRPSRSGFASKLRGHLMKNGVSDVVVFDPDQPRRTGEVVIYHDADEAKKRLKHVSPLVTMQCKSRQSVKDLDRFAKREGLSAVEHEGNVIGFYPGGGRKGKDWEKYIDDLRDDGQSV